MLGNHLADARPSYHHRASNFGRFRLRCLCLATASNLRVWAGLGLGGYLFASSLFFKTAESETLPLFWLVLPSSMTEKLVQAVQIHTGSYISGL